MSREVMQQALEVLEASVDQLPKPYSTDCSNAITALRAALKEPEQPCPYVQWTDDGTHWCALAAKGEPK